MCVCVEGAGEEGGRGGASSSSARLRKCTMQHVCLLILANLGIYQVVKIPLNLIRRFSFFCTSQREFVRRFKRSLEGEKGCMPMLASACPGEKGVRY